MFAVFVFFKQRLFARPFVARGVDATHPAHRAKALVDPLVPNTGSCILILGSQGFTASVEICSEHRIPRSTVKSLADFATCSQQPPVVMF